MGSIVIGFPTQSLQQIFNNIGEGCGHSCNKPVLIYHLSHGNWFFFETKWQISLVQHKSIIWYLTMIFGFIQASTCKATDFVPLLTATPATAHCYAK